ncbi:MAG: hypothetical protein JJU33_09900 [Phycisphaerales bacterium]|nr:hypothetical protein [Phycisphaerales bacterium]
MEQHRSNGVVAALVLAAIAGMPASVANAEPEPTALESTESEPIKPGPVRFTLQEVPFRDVLDFFSTETGLPIIRETDVPRGSMTFLSGEALPFEEALSILNLNLAHQSVHLRREKNYLYLSSLKEAFRRPTPVFDGEAPEGITPDRIVTVNIPLSNARASAVAEQLAPLVGEYGSITPITAQNMVILIETAAQAERLGRVIRAIDAERTVDSDTRLFALQHARADEVVKALTGLIARREIVIEVQGNRRTEREELGLGGVSLQADQRTNSVIAVGPRERLETVDELVALLDAPDIGEGEREMVTFELQSVTSREAMTSVQALFRAVPENRRPTVLSMDEVNKLTIVGPRALLLQATALIGELDPKADNNTERDADSTRISRVVPLQHADPTRIEAIAQRLLSPRQRRALSMAQAPTGRAIVVTGPAGDVDAFERLVRGLDTEPEIRREVRVLRLERASAPDLVERAAGLLAESDPEGAESLAVNLEPESGRLTLIGAREQIRAFEELLRSIEASTPPQTEVRTYEPRVSRPSELATRIDRLAPAMLRPTDGSSFSPPSLEAMDELGTLIVRAEPEQFGVIESLIERLDSDRPAERELRVIGVARGEASKIADRASALYARMTEGREDLGEISLEVDEASGSLLISARPEALRLYAQAVEQAQRLLPPDRTTRMLEIQHVEASEIVGPLRELLEASGPTDPSRAIPEPGLRVVERTNTLLVTAEPAQHDVIRDFVRRLDRVEQSDLPPLRLLQLRAADANAIASMLHSQYQQRSQAERSARPVQVRADASTNTLIVSAHEELFDEIKSFVERLNDEGREGPERVTVLFNLQVARADDVARAMDRLYPTPPVPLDRQGRPMPWLQQEREVQVSADPSSNSLIIDAPAERISSLEELAAKLDRVQTPPSAELRTFRVVGADVEVVARTLQGLARSGNLSAPREAGRRTADVVIEAEPRSSTLIVAGDEITFERVEAMLRDLSAVPVEREVRIVPVVNADAADVRRRAVEIYEAQVRQIPDAGEVEVSVDESNNALQVVADREALDRFMRVVEQLQAQAGPKRQSRLIELRYADPAEAAEALRSLASTSQTLRIEGGPAPVFEPIEGTSTLLIAASSSQMPIIDQLVRGLDRQESADRPPLRILRLRSTDAVAVASMLQENFDRRPQDDRARRPVAVQADGSTNALMVSAHPELMPEIEAVVNELNEQQSFDADGREIRIFPLKVARAEELAKTIDQMFPAPPIPIDPRNRQPRPDLAQPKEVVVRADRATNSLIVDAPTQRLAGFEQLVKSLDQHQLAADVELRTYRLERADLDRAAQAVRQLASGGALGATGQTPVTVETEPGSRTLVVSGPSEIFAQVEKVLDGFDARPERPDTTVRMYALAHARADRLQPLMERLLVTRIREEELDRGGRAADSLLEVAADPASNTLIISAPESVHGVAEQLLRSLDQEHAGAGRESIRVVPLSYADPAEIGRTLNQTLPNTDLPSGGRVGVVAAPGSGAIVLTGLEADLDRVEALIEPLDRRPSDAEAVRVETFALQHADAEGIRRTVERLLVDQAANDPALMLQRIRLTRGQLPQRTPIGVEADARTNSLMVSGPAATVELAEAIIKRLDSPSPDGERTVLTFTPTNARAADLVRTADRVLASAMDGRSVVELIPEPGSGAIVVVAPADKAAEALAVLSDLDDRTPSVPPVEFRLYELEHADAQQVAQTVSRLLADRSRWPEALRRLESAGVRLTEPAVNADTQGGANRLLVSVPTPMMPLARELIETLDRPGQQGVVEVRVVRLRQGDAQSVASAIGEAMRGAARPGRPEIRVSAERASNSVVLSGTSDQIAEARALIGEMDIAVDADGVGVRTVFLRHARAETLAPLVERVLAKESDLDLVPEWARIQLLRERRQPREQAVRVAPEPRLNALVISGPAGTLALAEQVIGELDTTETAEREDREIRVLPVINADASELAASLEGLFDDETTTPPSVRVDRSANALVVRGTGEQIRRIERVAGQLDDATVRAGRSLRTIRVDRSRADAEVMAQTLRSLLERDSSVRVEVISAEELLRRQERRGPGSINAPIDEPLGVEGTHWLHRLMEAAVFGLSIETEGDDEGDDDPEPSPGGGSDGDRASDGTGDEKGVSVTIAVDPVTNALLVVGSSRLADRVAELARELQDQLPPEPTAVRVIGLPDGVDARGIVGVVRETVGQVGRASDQNPAGFTGRVGITADPAGDAVIVWANDTDFEVLGTLIASIARAGAGESRTVKIYPLSNIQGPQAVSAVRDFLSPQPRGRQARRLRELDLTVDGPEGRVRGSVDPATVFVMSDPGQGSLIVSAPPESLELIDAFVSLIDQSPAQNRMSIRRYTLENADARRLSGTMQGLFDAQRQDAASRQSPRARFFVDERTNTLLVTASDEQHAEVRRLLDETDTSLADDGSVTEVFTLKQASPSSVRRVLEQVLIGRDEARRDRIRITAEDASSVVVVRATVEEIAQASALIERLDEAETGGFPLRTIRLERANAQTVAQSLQQFFRDRTRAGERGASGGVAVFGDRRSGTLIVAASEDDFAQVEAMAAALDEPAEARQLDIRMVRLENIRVSEIQQTLDELVWNLQAERLWGRQPQPDAEQLYISTVERSNTVMLLGQGDLLATAERVVGMLDSAPDEGARRIVRAVRAERVDLNAVRGLIQEAFSTPGWRPWQGTDPQRVQVQVDRGRRLLLLVGVAERVDEAEQFIKELDASAEREGVKIETITLRHAQAGRAAGSLQRFFQGRAQIDGSESAVSVLGSPDGNILIVAAPEDDLRIVRDLVAQMDQPELGDHRLVEVYTLRNAQANETAQAVRQMFPATRSEERIIVTPQPSTNSLIVSVPETIEDRVRALITELDRAPTSDDVTFVTVPLDSASATEVAAAVRASLPENIKVRITPVARSNALVLSGSREAVDLVMQQVEKLDTEPARSLVRFRRFTLQNATANDVRFTLNAMFRDRRYGAGEPRPAFDFNPTDNTIAVSATPEQMEEIEEIITAVDVAPDGDRRTEFVKLRFADAKQIADALQVFYGRFAPEAATPGAKRVTIVPDPASNSLVISADEPEWPGISALLDQLDTEEYDTSRQLAVIPLRHADARSVARSLSEAFRATLDRQVDRERLQRERDRQRTRDDRDFFDIPVLVSGEETPIVSAEAQSNALIVFASRPDLERIERIVERLDVPDVLQLPEPRIIRVRSGRPTRIAESVRSMFASRVDAGGGTRSVQVIGDDDAGVILVRADETQFAQIESLVESLGAMSGESGALPRVLAVGEGSAARMRDTVARSFGPIAQRRGEIFAIEVDRASNSLVVSSSEDIFEQVRAVVRELGGIGGGGGAPGRGVLIIDIEHNEPAEIRRLLEQMGVTREPAAGQAGLVTEPVAIIPMTSRRALAVVADTRDAETVADLVRAMDAEPAGADQFVEVVPLKLAEASAVVQTLRRMLNPEDQTTGAAPARSLVEQIRRLSIAADRWDKPAAELDLSVPIRLQEHGQSNAIVIASSEANVKALKGVVKMLDTLPIGDAVVVRIFPLKNASASRLRGVIDEVFRQGEALRRLPGTQRRGQPTTATGRALAGEIAVSVDERTNALIVAGREEAVALVEVLIRDMDSDEGGRWVETTLIPVEHADPTRLAAKLSEVLVTGVGRTPEAEALRRQVGRLRVLQAGGDPTDPSQFAETDLVAPLSGLLITPETQLNALIVVGSEANVNAVRELVSMLDVEAASASNEVRVFPLRFAAADRVAQIVRQVFTERERVGEARPEDRVVVQADLRTNALIVSTSRRSLDILEGLLDTLDREHATDAVGLHVIAVPDTDVNALAPRLQRLVAERIEATRRAGVPQSPSDAFRIEPEPATGSLIVAASEENLRLVRELIRALATGDAERTTGQKTEILYVDRGRAGEITQAINEMYVRRENQRRGAGSVGVMANDRLNALVVTGSENDIGEIRRLVVQLDAGEIRTEQDIRRIELRTANAIEVVNLLQTILAGRPIGGGQGSIAAQQATRVRFFRNQLRSRIETEIGEAPSEAQIDGAIRDQVRLTFDLRTNSVLVAAPPQIMSLIEEIIDDLDSTTAGNRKIEVFRLQNADAGAMRGVLRDLFNLQQQGNRLVLIPTQSADLVGDEQGPSLLDATRVTPVPDERQELAITIDPRTNTLLVSGTEEYLDLVRNVIESLDNIEATERERFVYHLRNAKALEMETTLTNFFREESVRIRETLRDDQLGALSRQLEQEVTVVGDEKSNKLVITASPRYIESVRRIVEELDAAPPQVVIQVLLAEVTIDQEQTWGMDIEVGPFGGEDYIIGSAPAGVAVATALGVPNLSVASQDFGLLIRSLEQQGRLEVLSRPEVTVTNNEPAVIQVGENIAIIDDVETFESGRTRANVSRRDVGIILNVTPTISPDGFVRMEINPEISQVSQRTTRISEDFESPIITQRLVDTIVTVKDGQTVVIGGLIQTTDQERRTKVPILGDIPILGRAFQTDLRSSVKTELLVILTPRVIHGTKPEDVAKQRVLSDVSIDRMAAVANVRRILDRESRKEIPEVRPGIARPERGEGGMLIEPTRRLPSPGQETQEQPAQRSGGGWWSGGDDDRE